MLQQILTAVQKAKPRSFKRPEASAMLRGRQHSEPRADLLNYLRALGHAYKLSFINL